MTTRSTQRLLLVAFVLIVFSHTFFGQSTPQRGFHPGGAYAVSDFETINTNMWTGNLMFRFPLGNLPVGRGGLSAGISLNYDSKIYDSHIERYEDFDYGTPPDPAIIPRNVLSQSNQGGWIMQTGYYLELIDRLAEYSSYPLFGDDNANYRFKLKVHFPDGSSHELLPRDYGSQGMGDGYYNYMPDGYRASWTAWPGQTPTIVPISGFSGNTHYYSFDGTYLRLDVEHDSEWGWWNNAWTLTFPDGSRVVTSKTNPQRLYDRNGNYVEMVARDSGGNPISGIRDQLGRQVWIESTTSNTTKVHNVGFENADLVYEIFWKIIQVGGKTYTTFETCCTYNPNGYPQDLGTLAVVSQIKLPTQSGDISYFFDYNAQDYGSEPWGTPSEGLGEVKSVTTPSGAVVNYVYYLDNKWGPDPWEFTWEKLLRNRVIAKGLTYDQVYDGSTTSVTENTSFPGYGGISNSAGGFTEMGTDAGRVYWTKSPDGTVVEKVWAANTPEGFPTAWQYDPVTGINAYDASRANGFVKWELTSIPNAAGTSLVSTAIKEFTQDKNGNTTSVTEYDWVAYSAVTRDSNGVPTAIPGTNKKRVTTNTYAYSTPASTDTSTNSSNAYWNYSSPNLRTAATKTEVADATTVKTRTDLIYDNAGTTGNVTEVRSWDSTKGSATTTLSSSNAVITTNQYDSYGNITLTTDARGTQTTSTYGSVGGYTGLYPTQVVVASNVSALDRTTTLVSDFYTGLVKSATDADNSVTTTSDYDDFGRPTLVKVADGVTAKETRTSTEYNDEARRVIVKSDLVNVGDEKLVTIQHYDQVGRIRLTRQLEDPATETPEDETDGIKVQTRYGLNRCANYSTGCPNDANGETGSYQLVSNPYRASTSGAATSESTMGWTISNTNKNGQLVTVKTFGSAALPYPWGSSSVNTGTVTTSYEENFTTVADQMGRLRRSKIDGLGRLIRVDEPNSSNSLGSLSSPNQPTVYDYDALGNLISVDQNTTYQAARTFSYSSLGRLLSAVNPESGTTNYQYDNSGNLIVKSDARGVSTHFIYDELNRLTRRAYNTSTSPTSTTHNSPALPSALGTTEEAKFYYDSQSLPSGAPSFSRGASAGRLVAQVYGTGSNGDYFAYDELGQVPLKIQQTGSVNYEMSALYNRSGAMTSLTYPSGHTITNTLDTAGRLSGFTGNLGDGTTRDYATEILYGPTGALVKEKFGTSTAIYNKLFYNSRGQLAEIRVGTTYTGPTDGGLNRGAIINHYSDQCWGACGGLAMTDNNGNLQKQEMYIPDDDGVTGWTMRWQQYGYDSLNRLQSAREILDGTGEQWKQSYLYDRWGNRKIDTNSSNTYGLGGNNTGFAINKAFDVNVANNRLAVPSSQTGVMEYDDNGNLKNDTYTGAGARKYDGENKMTYAWGGNNQAQLYTYDATGQRIKRAVNGVETWAVYGLGGEMLAEYSSSGAANSPQKEYGYRNGQLLVTAEGPSSVDRTNVALASNGATASASSVYSGTYAASKANDGARINGEWTDASSSGPSDWLQIDFSSSKTIEEIDVFTVQDNYYGQSTPTESMTFSLYGITTFTVQYWNGSGWSTVLGGSITGNNKVWKKINFPPVTTTKILVTVTGTVDGSSRITELEAWTSNSANWLVADQLGTPRMIFDESGNLSTVTRHDYLPFGEELYAPVAGRNSGQGYGSGDQVRQQYTSKERDNETGLDYFSARYYASVHGRFTSPDSYGGRLVNPQTLNRYSYVHNNPLKYVDPTGHEDQNPKKKGKKGNNEEDVEEEFLNTEDTPEVVVIDSQPANPTTRHEPPPGIDWNAVRERWQGRSDAIRNTILRTTASPVSSWIRLFGGEEAVKEYHHVSMALLPLAMVARVEVGAEEMEAVFEGEMDAFIEETLVVRGGQCLIENFQKPGEVNANGLLEGASVNSMPGVSLQQLSTTIPNNQIGVTTVSKIEAAGGIIRPAGNLRNPYHSLLNGITAEKAHELFTPTIRNPNKP